MTTMKRKLNARLAGIIFGAVAAGAALPSVAHAQSQRQGPEVAETKGGQAAPLFQEGNRAADEKRWADAEIAFLKAWAIVKSYDVAANLGEVELRLGKPRLAAVHLAFSLRTAPPSAKAPNLDRTRYFLNEAKMQLGVVRVQVTPPEGEVLVDGEPLPAEETAEELFLEPGTHRVAARRAGYAEAEKVVTVVAGTLQDVMLVLAEPPAASPPMPTPMRDAPAAHAQPEAKRSWVPAIALGAASAVALGVGIGTTLASNAASEDVDRQTREILGAGGQCAKPTDAFVARCSEIHRTGTRADAFGNAARVAYVAAGALAVATVGYVLWPSRKPSGSAQVGAWLDVRSDSLGVGAVGVW
ncbi:PEGA domain-containing protein [Sorangium sp. So ce134]